MTKVKFLRTKNGICIYLDDGLFSDDKSKIEKILSVIKIFSVEKLMLKCICFVDNNDDFFNEINNAIDCSREILIKKPKYYKIKIEFKGKYINKLIELAIKHNKLVEIEYDEDKLILLQFIINDNDGSCIIFDKNKFDINDVKKKTLNIIKS